MLDWHSDINQDVIKRLILENPLKHFPAVQIEILVGVSRPEKQQENALSEQSYLFQEMIEAFISANLELAAHPDPSALLLREPNALDDTGCVSFVV
jgi:hypothetical protein